jgi:5-methyltetrahydropteroyltriglutamate--homocysteine methyltransferase
MPDRILTTHVGSLPRPPELTRLVVDAYMGMTVDAAELEQAIAAAVATMVARQRAVGIDIPSDGECSKVAFSHYVHQRFSGFTEIGSARLIVDDLVDYPGVAEKALRAGDRDTAHATAMFSCDGPITVRDREAVHQDCRRFRAALGDTPPARAFLGAPTPGHIAFNFPNRYYPSYEDYLAALADAMRYEYLAITGAGFTLQLDSPDLAMSAHVRTEGANAPPHEQHRALALEALDRAIAGIPPERLRLHICWGNYPGPHHRDIPLIAVLEPALKTRVGTISFEAANPRHAHEWEVFRDVRLPDGKMIMPGVLDVTTQRIEHPELVAQRLIQFARLVGRENVIAGADCGFSTVAGWEHVDPEVAWAKLASLVEGAEIASRVLWQRA